MRLRGSGNGRGKNAVAREHVAVGAGIVHRSGRPACRIGRVGFADVTSGLHGLRLQRHRSHAVCIRDARRNHHRLSRERKIRRVNDIANGRRCDAHKCRIRRARSLRQRHIRGTAPRTAEIVFERRMNQLNARSRARCGSRPRKTFREIHIVHLHIRSVAQLDRLAGFFQLTNPLPERCKTIRRLKPRTIRRDDHVSASRNRRRGREQKIHRIHKAPASHAHCGSRRIPQFDKLRVLRPVARLVEDFIDDNWRFRLRRKTQRRRPSRARSIGRSRAEKVSRRRREIVRQTAERRRLQPERRRTRPSASARSAVRRAPIKRHHRLVVADGIHAPIQPRRVAGDSRSRARLQRRRNRRRRGERRRRIRPIRARAVLRKRSEKIRRVLRQPRHRRARRTSLHTEVHDRRPIARSRPAIHSAVIDLHVRILKPCARHIRRQRRRACADSRRRTIHHDRRTHHQRRAKRLHLREREKLRIERLDPHLPTASIWREQKAKIMRRRCAH